MEENVILLFSGIDLRKRRPIRIKTIPKKNIFKKLKGNKINTEVVAGRTAQTNPNIPIQKEEKMIIDLLPIRSTNGFANKPTMTVDKLPAMV